jgi:leucyl/phenylalanyl-tRNA--protein transferase
MGRLGGGVRFCVRFGRRVVSKLYRVFLARVALKLFRRPETAICYACNAMAASPERVISNYCQGLVLLGKNIHGDLIWHDFPERSIITPETAHISKRLRRYMKRDEFTIRVDKDFEAVVRACQREGWTWVNEATIDIYTRLFSMGFARCMEAHQDGELVAGLWGLEVGSTFAAMSMFHRVDRAGAVLFGAMVEMLTSGDWDMVDCGVQHDHFRNFGAQDVSREPFVEMVVHGLHRTKSSGTRHGRPTAGARPQFTSPTE